MAFESPWLWLSLLPLAALVVYVLRRSDSPLRLTRQLAGGAGLVLACFALLMVATGAVFPRPTEARTVWVLVDRSLSVGDATERRLHTVLDDLKRALKPGDHIGVIAFAGNATVVLPATPARDVNADLSLPVLESGYETYAGPAIDLASRLAVPGTSNVMLLIGDGHDTEGHVASRIQGRGLRLYTMPVDSDPPPEVALANVRARLAGTDPPMLAADLDIHSTLAQQVAVYARVNNRDYNATVRGERVAADGRVAVTPGRNTVRVEVEVPHVLPIYQLEVGVVPQRDTLTTNNQALLNVRGRGDGRVLVVHGDDGPETSLVRALRRGGIDVTQGPAAILPDTIIQLERYQAVVLSSVAAHDLTIAQHQMLNNYVRGGGGLAMIGGPSSFAAGGYFDTPIEAVLPVDCRVIERGREQIAAIVVALDRSGSMGARVGGMSKMELANEGCVRTIELAPPGAWFGMLSVDTGPEWIIPLSPLADRRLATARARAHQPGGGGIYVDIAADEAFTALSSVDAASRHLILFSDGADTERQEGVLELTDYAYRQYGITTTAICLGDGQDRQFLENMAAAGRGRFFLVTDPSHLPAVFSREAALTAGTFIREDAFRAVLGVPGSLTEGARFQEGTAPPLLGYVATTAREEATVWLWADEERERPLLATWNVELGRALAFTSDARDRWATPWLNDERYAMLWQRWVRWLLPAPERTSGVESEWTQSADGPRLNVAFFDQHGMPRQTGELQVQGILPDGTTQPLTTMPAGTGVLDIQFPRAGPGSYEVRIADAEGAIVAREYRMFVPVDEFQRRPANIAALEALARAGNGELVRGARDVAVAPLSSATAPDPMRGTLIGLALLGLFMGIGARRLPTVWRRSQSAQTAPEAADENAVQAFRRLQQRRGKDAAPQPPAQASNSWGSAPPRPAQDAPPRVAPAKDTDDGGLESALSAMRKVRKQIKGD